MATLAGISFPFRNEGKGLPKEATGTAAIRSSIVALLRTPRRSRVMRPNLGTDLQRLIFENTGELLRSMINREIAVAVGNEIPQVQIQSIDITESLKTVTVNVFYSIQGVQDSTGDISFERAA